MKQKLFNKILFIITLGGALFSGYLSSVKFFLMRCSFGEACPNFLGYPACYYGFALFATLFTISAFALAEKIKTNTYVKLMSVVSTVGVLFSGYFVILENFKLSTCSIGFLFFIIVCILSIRQNKFSRINTN